MVFALLFSVIMLKGRGVAVGVGTAVGFAVGLGVGFAVGLGVGFAVGLGVGFAVGLGVGLGVRVGAGVFVAAGGTASSNLIISPTLEIVVLSPEGIVMRIIIRSFLFRFRFENLNVPSPFAN